MATGRVGELKTVNYETGGDHHGIPTHRHKTVKVWVSVISRIYDPQTVNKSIKPTVWHVHASTNRNGFAYADSWRLAWDQRHQEQMLPDA